MSQQEIVHQPYTGLSETEAKQRIDRYGYNRIEEKHPGIIKKFFQWIISPISLMLIGAAALSYATHKTFDFYFIIVLALLNFTISFWQEYKANKAIEELRKELETSAKVLRDGVWKKIPSSSLVPDDVVEIGLGNIIPADVVFLEAKNLSINEAALTGESLPVEKSIEDSAYAGSFVVTGKGIAKVTSTGTRTYFGKTLQMVEKTSRRSILEKDILRIAKFLSLLSVVAVVVLSIVFIALKQPLLDTLTLDLSLIIAGIPVSLPTIMTLIISLGVLQLTKKKAVVRRLSSLEDLANVTLLLTDKTGTLTENKIQVHDVISYDDSTEKTATYAAFCALNDNEGPIRDAVLSYAQQQHIDTDSKTISDYTPADSKLKYSSATIQTQNSSQTFTLGTPSVIKTFCALDNKQLQRLHDDVEKAAQDGYRSIAVALGDRIVPNSMHLSGILLLSDTLRPEAKETIKFLQQNGVRVEMVTGDHRAISERIGEEIGLPPNAIHAQTLPADKYQLVKDRMEQGVVAVTGDGVNDLPAVTTANVGIAVGSAVDALKNAADIVLLSSGISVIKEAIVEAKRIFHRLYSYSIYRISESFRVIISILILGLAYKTYPLTPIHLILLALLNDIPIISLAYNRVRIANKPAQIQVKERFVLSSLFGLVGLANSLILFFVLYNIVHVPWNQIQTIFFLKLAVSGHLLIYVAHTKERWYKFLPSWQVISATMGTQLVATALAVTGIFMDKISIEWALIVWIWSFFWMQIGEVTKHLSARITKNAHRA